MNVTAKLLLGVLGGIGIGAAAVELAQASAKPPAFQIVEYEVTDPAGFQTYIKGADAIHSSGIFLARHAKGKSLSGEPPKWIGILQYPSLEDALASRRVHAVGAPVPQSTPIITLEALTIAYALAPGLSPSFSADFLVMIDTTSMPGANSTTTSVSTAPGVTALTVAGRTLRALNFMAYSS